MDAKIDHISFYWDALILIFNFAKTKTDQEGIKNIDHPWHVYATPLDPIVFPVTVLAQYMITNLSILTGKTNLFEGKS